MVTCATKQNVFADVFCLTVALLCCILYYVRDLLPVWVCECYFYYTVSQK